MPLAGVRWSRGAFPCDGCSPATRCAAASRLTATPEGVRSDIAEKRSQAIDGEKEAESVAGILNALPFQGPLYRAWSNESGAVRVLRRNASEPPVRRWQAYGAVLVDELTARIMRRIDPHAPAPPANTGIRFEDTQPRGGVIE